MTNIQVEPGEQAVHGKCPDCGEFTGTCWGYVSSDGAARCAYFIRWTDGHLERGAQVLVSIGRWGGDAGAAHRRSFAVECRMGVDRPGFMVIDAGRTPWAKDQFLGEKLSREDALKDPLLKEVFEVLDRLVDDSGDPRFRAFLLSGKSN